MNALQTLAGSPASNAARQALLSQAQALAQQIGGYDAQISQFGGTLEQQISGDVTQVNTLASGIASLNTQIANDLAGTGQAPNQLMDQRDTLIDQLSQYASVNTASEPNGMLDVYIGTGQALVTGGTAQQLSTLPNQYNASALDIGITSGGGTADVTSEITGGELGGLLASRTQVLDPAQNALGQISVALATIVNQQQAAGMDQTGAAGQPMFTVGGVQTLASSTNSGSATLAVTRTSLSALTSDDYTLRYSGGAWQLKDSTTGQAVPLTGAGTSASPFQAAGIAIVVSGAPAGGDSFLVQPTATATAGLSVALTDPAQIAAASLAQTGVGAANAGTATISAASVEPGDLGARHLQPLLHHRQSVPGDEQRRHRGRLRNLRRRGTDQLCGRAGHGERHARQPGTASPCAAAPRPMRATTATPTRSAPHSGPPASPAAPLP